MTLTPSKKNISAYPELFYTLDSHKDDSSHHHYSHNHILDAAPQHPPSFKEVTTNITIVLLPPVKASAP